MYEYIRSNIELIKQRIKAAAERAGRSEKDIMLMAVTKTVDVDKINAAIDYGVYDIGENRVQEMLTKYPYVRPDVRWHMIGRLQTNKVKYIVDKVSLIHSVDSIKLINEINKRAEKINRIIDVLIEVNMAGEVTKGGIMPDELMPFLQQCLGYTHVRVKGLMTVAPQFHDQEKTRPFFAGLRELSQRVCRMGIKGVDMEYLSMGMSGDFEVAIEEGANIVRIGTAIFGSRQLL